jgi:hypothetical protein
VWMLSVPYMWIQWTRLNLMKRITRVKTSTNC